MARGGDSYATVNDALTDIAARVTRAMMLPDAQGPVAQGLAQLHQAIIGLGKMGNGRPNAPMGPAGAPAAPGTPAAQPGGMNIPGIMGKPQGPSGAMPPGRRPGQGVDPEQVRQLVAAGAGGSDDDDGGDGD